jgi:hypothetical protein
MPSQLRQLFVQVLSNEDVTNHLQLFDLFVSPMCEDLRNEFPNPEHRKQRCLAELEQLFNMLGKSCADFGLEVFRFVLGGLSDGSQHSTLANQQLASRNIPLLNPEQSDIFQRVTGAVIDHQLQQQRGNNLFFIDGPAGTGKTFLLEVSCFVNSNSKRID